MNIPNQCQRLYKSIQNRQIIFLIAYIVTCLFIVSKVIAVGGWPYNHEGISFFYRTQVYANHFLQGDFFPIWAGADNYGMGSPLPLFYHKTFYYISGFIYLLVGSLKLTIIVSLIFFMLIGVYGTRKAIAVITNRQEAIFFAPLMLLLANYTFTDWLIRGAMAEFSAMMLLPWLIWWCLNLVKNQKFSYYIIPILILLFNAHNITAVVAGFTCVIAWIITMFTISNKQRIEILKKSLIAVVVFAGIMFPLLFLQALNADNFNPSKVTQLGNMASEKILPSMKYLADDYVWLKSWEGLKVQLDIPLLVASIVLFVYLVFNYRQYKKQSHEYVLIFLSVSLFVLLFLQTRFSKGIYEAIVPLQYLQFPWRLLSLITILFIALYVYLLVNSLQVKSKGGMPKNAGLLILAVTILCMATFSPLFSKFQYESYSQKSIDAINIQNSSGAKNILLGIGEYLPRTYDGRNNEISSVETYAMYTNIYKSGYKLNSSCTNLYPNHSENIKMSIKITCIKDESYTLPLTYSKYYKIKVNGQEVEYSKSKDSLVQLNNRLRPGITNIEIDKPTILSTVSKLIHQNE